MQKEDLYSYDDQFRDRISTVDNSGKRLWVFPKKSSGRYHNARVYVAILLLGLLFAGPFIKTDGHPFMLFDIMNRRFVIFGTPFWPQDFHIFAIGFITFVVFIVLFTVVYGRAWCGWACPQTIFMEMIFRKIEYLVEGDSGKQRKLDQMPWKMGKIVKRAAKHFIFILISILISHSLMAYLVGIETVKMLVSHSPMENLAGFAGIVFFTGFFYFVFAYFREQVCTTICPYGRLQGVFVGKNTIAVMYDWLRGEPRGRLKKGQHDVPAGNGDCVDCKLCIHVCPTGIDIRNGVQLECVNCTACMDACDEVMDKISRKKGLIRFGSYNSICESKQNLFTPRVIGYSVVLSLLIAFLIYFIGDRPAVETTVLRVPGTLYQAQENERISNLYNIQFINKTFHNIDLELKLEGYPESEIKQVGEPGIHIPSNNEYQGIFFIEMPEESLHKSKTALEIAVVNHGEVIDKVRTNFFSPMKRK